MNNTQCIRFHMTFEPTCIDCIGRYNFLMLSLQWRHNELDGTSNHLHIDCLLNRLFQRRSMKTSKLCVTGLCEGNSPVTGDTDVSFWWRHYGDLGPTRGGGIAWWSTISRDTITNTGIAAINLPFTVISSVKSHVIMPTQSYTGLIILVLPLYLTFLFS